MIRRTIYNKTNRKRRKLYQPFMQKELRGGDLSCDLEWEGIVAQ